MKNCTIDEEILDVSLLRESQDFEEESQQEEEPASYIFASIVILIAIGIAAALAHVSGKANWIQ